MRSQSFPRVYPETPRFRCEPGLRGGPALVVKETSPPAAEKGYLRHGSQENRKEWNWFEKKKKKEKENLDLDPRPPLCPVSTGVSSPRGTGPRCVNGAAQGPFVLRPL